MKTLGFFAVLLLLSLIAPETAAQNSTGEIPYGIKEQIIPSNQKSIQYHFDLSKHPQEYSATELPLLAGFAVEADLLFSAHAVPQRIDDTQTIWQLHLEAPGAEMLGVVFSDLWLGEGEKLFVYDASGRHYIGAFTMQNNKEHGFLSTATLPSSSLIIEFITSNAIIPDFSIEELIYIPFAEELEHIYLKSSGSCNVNVNCSEGLLWQKQKRGVARILLRQGTTWYNCSGSLVNNTEQNAIPYMLTADHCGASASAADLLVWQFYFNNEYADCVNAGVAPNNMMLTGSTLMAKGPLQGGSDFKLLLLEDDVPQNWNPYYNGWSRFPLATENGVGIHHPSGDAKKISTYTATPTSATYAGGMTTAFWRMNWVETENGWGITEGGSSGSPLFETNGLITGTLTGGSASCANPQNPDLYGKFDRHWQANGEATDRRLQPWLDPNNEAPVMLYGYDPNRVTNFVFVEVLPDESGEVLGNGYYAENEIISLTAAPFDGFKFVNWTTAEGVELSTSTAYEFVMPSQEITILANFAEIQPTVPDDIAKQKIEIYPNPASSIVTISNENFTGTVDIKIYNTLGFLVFSRNYQNAQGNFSEIIALNDFNNGIYLMQITNQDHFFTQKIIIKNK